MTSCPQRCSCLRDTFALLEALDVQTPIFLLSQDVLRSRVRTTGIVQSDFVIKKVNFS